jgi:hypothetical protein
MAPHVDLPFSGAHWEVIDDGPGRVMRRCLGLIDGPRFLDGRTADGTVGLAPSTDPPFSGTHWQVVDPLPIDSVQMVSGNLAATVSSEMKRVNST